MNSWCDHIISSSRCMTLNFCFKVQIGSSSRMQDELCWIGKMRIIDTANMQWSKYRVWKFPKRKRIEESRTDWREFVRCCTFSWRLLWIPSILFWFLITPPPTLLRLTPLDTYLGKFLKFLSDCLSTSKVPLKTWMYKIAVQPFFFFFF